MIELDFNNILYNVLGPSHSIGEPELNNAIKDNARICREIQDESWDKSKIIGNFMRSANKESDIYIILSNNHEFFTRHIGEASPSLGYVFVEDRKEDNLQILIALFVTKYI